MAGSVGNMLAAPFNRFLLALEHKDYLTLWTANLCAGSASWALIVSRAVLADQYTELYFWVGVVTFAAMIPPGILHRHYGFPGRPLRPPNRPAVDLHP